MAKWKSGEDVRVGDIYTCVPSISLAVQYRVIDINPLNYELTYESQVSYHGGRLKLDKTKDRYLVRRADGSVPIRGKEPRSGFSRFIQEKGL